MQKILNVRIGDVKIAKNGELLKAILGSCVGIGFIWKEKQICGLAHCLLPESPELTYAIGGRFVDQAIRSLIALMKIKKENYEAVDVIVAGGGNMTMPGMTDESRLIGSNNVKSAVKNLDSLGFCIKYKEIGGETGKKIYIDGEHLAFKVENIPRIVGAS